MKKMYEINWHGEKDEFSHYSVTPIMIVREGILPGCTKSSITAVDCNGNSFRGSLNDYYETEGAAWAAVVKIISETIKNNALCITKLETETKVLRGYLENIAVVDTEDAA